MFVAIYRNVNEMAKKSMFSKLLGNSEMETRQVCLRSDMKTETCQDTMAPTNKWKLELRKPNKYIQHLFHDR